ncbi:MAG TPA: hypothetical protein VMP00_15125 [Burkholderiales bacterium]|nr:hypothetical protein [Burkholderiales bacterium]
MIKPISTGLTAAVFMLALGLASDVTAQAAPSNPWTMVLAPATTCHPDDDFGERLVAASAAIQAAMQRQETVNAAAKETFDAMDMSEKAQRMQAFMMQNPQEAMKILQAEQAAGTSGQADIAAAGESATRLEAELVQLQASFNSAADQAVKPVQARQNELIKAKTVEVGEVAISMFTNAADHAEYVRLIAEENAAYERACAPYFGANGKFHTWLNSYRTEVIDRMISAAEAGEGALVGQMAAMGLPGGGYRPTTAFQEVDNFILKMSSVYQLRRNKAKGWVERRK